MEKLDYTLYYLSSSEDATNVRYIGITCRTPMYRLKKHIYDSPFKDTYKDRWIKSVLKRGFKLLIFTIADGLSEKKAKELEILYIKEAKEVGFNLVNTTEGGGGFRGKKSEEHINKISLANTGKKATLETRMKISEAVKKRPKPSQELVKKMMAGIRATPYTEERKQKLRIAQTGRVKSEDTIQKLRIAGIGRVKTKEEVLKRLEKTMVPVVQKTKNGGILVAYKCSAYAMKHTGIDSSTITAVCRGKRKSAGGFVWEYYKKEIHGELKFV